MADALSAEEEASWRVIADAAQTQDTEAALFQLFDAEELRRLFATLDAARAERDAAEARGEARGLDMAAELVRGQGYPARAAAIRALKAGPRG